MSWQASFPIVYEGNLKVSPSQEPMTVGSLFIEGKSHSFGETCSLLMIVSPTFIIMQKKIDAE